MPWPIRLGPEPRMITAGLLARRDLGLLVVGASSGTACARRTRPHRCRRSCRPGGRRARAGRRGRRPPSCRACAPIWASEKPCRLASRSSAGVSSSASTTSCATSLISTSWSRNHGSMPVASRTSSASRRRAAPACTSRSRPSCGVLIPCEQRVLVEVDAARAASRTARPCFSSERSAFCSASVKLRPIAIASPTRLHVRGQRRVGGRELLEGEPRHLDHDVVQRRLEAGRASRSVMSLGISSRV